MTNAAVETIYHTTMASDYSAPTLITNQPPSQPSMMTSQMPAYQNMHENVMGFASFHQVRSFLIGYRDCAAEAIRFLVEEEHVPVEDPLIVGLVNRLIEQERAIAMHDMIFAQASQIGSGVQTTSSHEQNEGLSAMDTNSTETLSSEHHLPHHPEISDSQQSHFNDSGLHEHTEENICSTNASTVSQVSNETEIDCDSDTAKIASLAGEILALLQGDSLSDFEDDSDSDEGFHDTDIDDSL